jgi:hypothetical protein
MKVDERALAGIRIKVERAHKQFMALGEEMRAFDKRKAFRIERQMNADGSQHIRRLFITEPIPIEWGVKLGEAVHNLRSALDQSVYWLTIDHTRSELPMTAFPVFTRRKRLGREWGFADTSRKNPDGIPGSGLYMLRGVGPGPRAFIEAVQPYPQRNGPLPKALLSLHDFWNQDKHRLVHLFQPVSVPRHVTVRGEGPRSEFTIWFPHHPVKSGAVILKVTMDPPNRNVDVRGETKIVTALKNPGRHRRSATVTLMEMFWDNAAIVARLLNAVGRQDEPVPLGAIPDTDVLKNAPWRIAK